MVAELLELKGCIVSIDLMECQWETAESIAAKEAGFILVVKGNQEFLLDDLQKAFAQSRSHSKNPN